MKPPLELTVRRDGDTVRLCAPAVGVFTCAAEAGRLLSPGAGAGVLLSLDVARELVVPAGVSGRVVSARPERIHEPVGFGTVLYELAPIEAGDVPGATTGETASTVASLALPAPHSGRFWHRPSPNDDAFVAAGEVIGPGHPVGMIEVMKTFTHVLYDPGKNLPARARILCLIAGDGAEVREGDPLVEVEPA